MNSIVISIEQTELEIWFERDRAHVELRNAQTGATILEFWDDDVSELVEDGFLNPRNWHDSLYDYAAYLGVIQRTEAGAPIMSQQDYIKLVEALRYGLGSLQADCFTRSEALKAQEHFAAHIAEAFAGNPLFNREHFLAVVRGERCRLMRGLVPSLGNPMLEVQSECTHNPMRGMRYKDISIPYAHAGWPGR